MASKSVNITESHVELIVKSFSKKIRFREAMNFEFMDMRTKSPNREEMLDHDGFTIEKYTFGSGIST